VSPAPAAKAGTLRVKRVKAEALQPTVAKAELQRMVVAAARAEVPARAVAWAAELAARAVAWAAELAARAVAWAAELAVRAAARAETQAVAVEPGMAAVKGVLATNAKAPTVSA
jgi:hypothetical protein